MDKYLNKTSTSRSEKEIHVNGDVGENANDACSCSSASTLASVHEDRKNLPSIKRKKGFSKVWKFFKSSHDKKLAKCLNCGKEYKTSGNTSNLKDHLKRFHPSIYFDCDEEGEVNGQWNDDSSTTGESYTTEGSGSGSASNRSSVRTINSYFKRSNEYDNNSLRKKEIDTSLAWMIAMDFQPFNIVDNSGFKYFMKVVDPRYVLPNKDTLKNKYVKSLYINAKEKLAVILNDVMYVGITCDCWTSCANENYLTVTCHFASNFKLNSAVLSTKRLIDVTNHNAENIATSLKDVLNEWKIYDKVSCIVTDNASTMIKACELLKMRHLPCFAHTINLVVQDALNVNAVKSIINRCKDIVRYFKSSSIAMEKFKLEQNTPQPYSLIQEVQTRWNSTHAMLKRILMTNDAINKVLLSTRKAPQPLTADEIIIITDIEKLLSCFNEATNQISGNTYVTVSLIIPLTVGIYHKIMELERDLVSTEAKTFNETLLSSIRKRLITYENRTIPRISTILDPRFKKEGFLLANNAEQSVIFLENEMTEFLKQKNICKVQVESTETSSHTYSAKQNSLFGFLEERLNQKVKSTKVDVIITKRQYLERTNCEADTDPLLFWKVTGTELYPMSECALKYLCIPATSVESERTFSTTGLILTDRRSRLKDKHVDTLTFLNKNKWLF